MGYGQAVQIVGDNQKGKNGQIYEVVGKDANVLPTNSTWTQKNLKT